MNTPENSAAPKVFARMPPTGDDLLERYLHLLRADPHILAAAAHPRREHTLQWASDELRHIAATLRGVSLEDAEYELKRVLEEARERLSLPV